MYVRSLNRTRISYSSGVIFKCEVPSQIKNSENSGGPQTYETASYLCCFVESMPKCCIEHSSGSVVLLGTRISKRRTKIVLSVGRVRGRYRYGVRRAALYSAALLRGDRRSFELSIMPDIPSRASRALSFSEPGLEPELKLSRSCGLRFFRHLFQKTMLVTIT